MPALISVIIPCYNQAHYLPDAVHSVLAQTYPYWECIIVDDGSEDDTEKIAVSFCITDERIKYIRKQNGGLSSARNKGLDAAKGAYIQFLDSDDRINENKFSSSVQQAADADVIMSNFKTFTSIDQLKDPPFKLHPELFNFHTLLTGWDDEFVFPPHAGLFRADLFKTLRFNETLKAREDWLMWLQVYQPGVKTVFIDQPYALYRSSPNSMSQDKLKMDKGLVEVYRIIYPMLPENEKAPFFYKAMNSFDELLFQAHYLTGITRQSESFKLGNFFIRKINWLKKIFR
jgi:glycosyltransferase involved in cell wall biosynthesis